MSAQHCPRTEHASRSSDAGHPGLSPSHTLHCANSADTAKPTRSWHPKHRWLATTTPSSRSPAPAPQQRYYGSLTTCAVGGAPSASSALPHHRWSTWWMPRSPSPSPTNSRSCRLGLQPRRSPSSAHRSVKTSLPPLPMLARRSPPISQTGCSPPPHKPSPPPPALPPDPPARLPPAWQSPSPGRSWAPGLAHEAALKLREAAQVWTESYPSMDYRHGPIAIAAPGRVVWHFGPAPDRLATEIAMTGGHCETGVLDPMAELVRAQRVALLRAQAQGLNPDAPRNLTRSVILPTS